MNSFRRRAVIQLPLLALLAPVVGCATLVPRGEGPPEMAVAPAFTLTAHDGKVHTLAQLIARGPAIVVFYRGFW